MYTTTAYYLSMCTTTFFVFILYPIVVTITSFYFFDIDDNSFGALMDWMLILTITAIAGGLWGFAFGTFMDNEVSATNLNTLFMMLFSFGAGFYANTGSGSTWFVKAISYVSPMRYTTQLLFERVIAGKQGSEFVLELLGFTWETTTCVMLLITFTLVCFVVGWLSLLWKTRNY